MDYHCFFLWVRSPVTNHIANPMASKYLLYPPIFSIASAVDQGFGPGMCLAVGIHGFSLGSHLGYKVRPPIYDSEVGL